MKRGGYTMSAEVDRAAALLFPDTGRQALDVKFFFQPGASVQALARQVIVCFEAMNDPCSTIASVD
jgi:hypothetical protein